MISANLLSLDNFLPVMSASGPRPIPVPPVLDFVSLRDAEPFLQAGLAGALGLALTVWLGGQLVLSGVFSIGTVIAFGLYVQQLYGPLTALTNARVEFATSLVSFERVFEVLDLPLEIVDRPGACDRVYAGADPDGGVREGGISSGVIWY